MQHKQTLQTVIQKLETYCTQHNLNHRFVGGVSFGGLLNENTTYKINIDKKIIYLKHHNQISLERSDHTIRDIDLISFCEESKEIKEFKKFIANVKEMKRKPFPDVSIEAAIHTKFKTRKHLFQFVTAYEVIDTDLYLAFDTILQKITWDSVEPWHVILENGLDYTVRNPIADYFAYYFRSPAGIKPKDVKKIVFVKKLADTLITQGKQHKPNAIDYMSAEYYGTWKDYIKKLRQAKSLSTKAKITWMKLYWQTVGNYLGHNQLLSRFATQFTGVRQ